MQDERLVATTVGWFGVPLLPTMTRAGPPMQRPRAPHDNVYFGEIGIALEFLAERVEPVPELLQSCFGGQATVSIVRGVTELNRGPYAHAIELSMPAPA